MITIQHPHNTPGPWRTPHTPPPWISHDTDEGEWVVDLPDALHASVTRLYFGDMETNTGTDIANADLVAAAPDLLAFARRVDAVARSDARGWADWARIADEARAAITKATGEAGS